VIHRPFHRLITILQSRSLKRDVIVITLLSVTGRSLGLLLPIFIAYWYGSSASTDAFFLAYAFMLFISTIIGNILEMVVVPYVTDLRARGEDISHFIGCIVFRGTVFIMGFSIAMVLILIPLMQAGTKLPVYADNLVFILTLEMMPMLFFLTWINVANGVLNAFKSFHVSAFSPFFRSVVVLAVAYMGRSWLGVHSIAIGFVFGEMIRWLISGYYYRKVVGPMTWRWESIPEVRPFFRSAFFQAVGFGFISFTVIIDQMMASWDGAGSLSLYTYADRLYRIPFQGFVTGLAAVLLTHWSHDFKFEKRLKWQRIRRMIWRFASIMGVIFLICLVSRRWLVDIVLNNGAFPSGQADRVADVFGILAAGLPFQMISLFCIRLLVIYEKNRYYMVLGFIRLALDVVLNYVLMKFFGIYGIAIATTLLNVLFAAAVYRKARIATMNLHSMRPVAPPGEGME